MFVTPNSPTHFGAVKAEWEVTEFHAKASDGSERVATLIDGEDNRLHYFLKRSG